MGGRQDMSNLAPKSEGWLAGYEHSSKVKAMATKKAFWDKKNPNKKSTPLTPAQKASAKARAKNAGRPYPNLVDNAAAKRSGRG